MKDESKEQKVWINLSETIKTGDYENVKVEAGFSKEYTDKDDPIAILEDGIKNLSKILKKKVKKVRRKSRRREY